MKNYQMELCGVQRTLPFIPISDDMAFASFVVLGDTELVSACAPVLAEKIGPGRRGRDGRGQGHRPGL